MSVFTNPASAAAEHAQQYVTAVLDLLGDQNPLEVLRTTPDVVLGMLAGLSREKLCQPEAPGKWSVRDVLQHLADSEIVAGYRFRMALAHERPLLTGYDQDRFAAGLHYGRADPLQAFEEFRALRQSNLALLGRLSPGDLQKIGVHAERGERTVEHMIRLAGGHDLVHIRQISRILEGV